MYENNLEKKIKKKKKHAHTVGGCANDAKKYFLKIVIIHCLAKRQRE